MVEEDFTILDQVPSVVHINVGGQLFLTSRETLLKVRHDSNTHPAVYINDLSALKRVMVVCIARCVLCTETVATCHERNDGCLARRGMLSAQARLSTHTASNL